MGLGQDQISPPLSLSETTGRTGSETSWKVGKERQSERSQTSYDRWHYKLFDPTCGMGTAVLSIETGDRGKGDMELATKHRIIRKLARELEL